MNKKRLANWIVSLGSTALVISLASVFGNEVPKHVATPKQEPHDAKQLTSTRTAFVTTEAQGHLSNAVPAHPEANQTSPIKSVATTQTPAQTPVHQPVSATHVAPPKSVSPAPIPTKTFTPTHTAVHAPAPVQTHKHTTTRAS